MELELLKDIVVIFGLSAAVLLLFHRIKAPTIVGFLITGIVAGPQGIGLIQATEQIGVLAEIGIVLLLFSVGIQISLRDLLGLKTYILVGGLLQVLLTVLAVSIILFEMGEPLGEALLPQDLADVLHQARKIKEVHDDHAQCDVRHCLFQKLPDPYEGLLEERA